MAKTERAVQRDYPYQGMAERVHAVNGVRGLSFVWPVCDICGALLADQELHDNFHAALTDDRE